MKYILFFIILAFSCTEKSEPLDYFIISDEFKSYVLFNTGSTWTYQEEHSGQTTKVYIDSTIHYLGINGLDPDNNVEFKYDAYESFIHSQNDLGYSKWEVAATNKSPGASQMTSLLRVYFTDEYHIALQPCYYFGDTISMGPVSGKYINMEYFNTYQVAGVDFGNVFHTRVLKNHNQGLIGIYDFYLARNFGIIRQEHRTSNDTTIWNLIGWDLNQ